MYTVYFIFLFLCNLFGRGGENFYYIIPFWDLILHSFSGIMLGALGFTLVTILNDSKVIKINLSLIFVSLFAFCFADRRRCSLGNL